MPELIALKKESFELMKKELLNVGILFVVALIIFKIIYYKDSFIVSLKFVAALFWLFAIPGYIIMFYWKEKLDFTERFTIGTALSAAVIGILSYYIGLLGLNIKYHGFLLPIVMIIVGTAINLKK